MCGRYYIDYEVDLVLQEIYESLFSAAAIGLLTGLREVFPDTSAATLVAAGDSGQRAVIKRWGEKKGTRPLVINARQETIQERPMFRNAIGTNRCIIPASGFYEWARSAGHKQKYRIRSESPGPIYLAGLYLPHADMDRYVIITTGSAGDMQLIHHRSPVLLEANECLPYLHDDSYAKARITTPNAPFQIQPESGGEPIQLSFLDLP